MAASSRRSASSKLLSPTSRYDDKPKPPRRRGRVLQDISASRIRVFVLVFACALLALLWGLYSSMVLFAPPEVVTPSIGFDLSEAQADVKMSDLYESIAFEDLDGGAWKQGWNVTYVGDEWNKQKLRVFVVPHSHNDPGWIRTVEEYYQEQSGKILSTIVQALRKDKRRKFIWEEVSYLERWWKDATDAEKRDFIRLVENGQLEIVGGGWVMNDEANSHYYAIIEQITEGNHWLHKTVGVIPKNSWAIDPFGHSPTMAYLLKQMGFQNMLIQRTHYEVKKVLARETNLEFFWRQSWDKYNRTDIFCHMMPFYSYDIPHTCGPEPAVCCQFDYWRLPGFGAAEHCPWGEDPQRITLDNIKERAEKLLDQYRKKSTLYKTNTLLVPLGDDFRYSTIAEADLQYENYQKIFDYINTHTKFKAELQFGTLEDYFVAAKAEMATRKGKVKFPSLSGDFFTYADRQQDYWSGYYVSRPFYKSMDRILEETLRAADILYSLSLAYCQPSDQNSFPFPSKEKLETARRTLALFQHHDGITGTAKNHVVVDYAQKMHSALLNLKIFMAQGMAAMLSRGSLEGACTNMNLEVFTPEKGYISHDMPAVKKVVSVRNDEVQRVVVYNPLEEAVNQVMMVLVERADVCVMSGEWEPIGSQVSPEWSNDKSGRSMSSGKHRLHWLARIPPMGIQTFFISVSKDSMSCKAANQALVKFSNAPDAAFSCPPPYECVQIEEEVVKISNQYQVMTFSVQDGLLKHLQNDRDGIEISLKEDIAFYSSFGSGAYLFKPVGEAKSIVDPGGSMVVTIGTLMQEVVTMPKTSWNPSPAHRTARLYTVSDSVQALMAEMEYHVELLGYDYNDKELIVRFKTDLDTENTFFSDLNGYQTIARHYQGKIPLQGNYYPMPSLAFLQGSEGRRFSLHSRQAVSVTSLGSGTIEVMLDRRLTRDDERGLGQGVLDNRPMDVMFHILLETNITSVPTIVASTPRVPSLLSHRVSAQLNYPTHSFFGRIENSSNAQRAPLQKKFAPLAADFPCDLHVVSFKAVEYSEKAEYALTLHRRGWDDSFCRRGRTDCIRMSDANMSTSDIFDHLTVSSVKTCSLNLLHDRAEDFSRLVVLGRKQRGGGSAVEKELISLAPMEIQSLKLRLLWEHSQQRIGMV